MCHITSSNRYHKTGSVSSRNEASSENRSPARILELRVTLHTTKLFIYFYSFFRYYLHQPSLVKQYDITNKIPCNIAERLGCL